MRKNQSSLMAVLTVFLLASCGKNAHVTEGDQLPLVNDDPNQLQQPLNTNNTSLPLNWASDQTKQNNDVLLAIPCDKQEQQQIVVYETPKKEVKNEEKRVVVAPKVEKLDLQIEPKKKEPVVTTPDVGTLTTEPKTESKPNCGLEAKEISVALSGLKEGEYDVASELPYQIKEESVKIAKNKSQMVSVSVTSLGEVDDKNVKDVNGVLVTKDNQVVFGGVLSDLPANVDAVASVESIKLSMGLTKFSNSSEFGSELFCSMDLKRCSGELVTDKKWNGFKNEAFFAESGSGPVNGELQKQLVRPDLMPAIADSRLTMKGLKGEILKTAQAQELDLGQMLALTASDLRSIVVEKSKVNAEGKRLIRFLTADDIYPLEPTLKISLTIDTCKLSQ